MRERYSRIRLSSLSEHCKCVFNSIMFIEKFMSVGVESVKTKVHRRWYEVRLKEETADQFTVYSSLLRIHKNSQTGFRQITVPDAGPLVTQPCGLCNPGGSQHKITIFNPSPNDKRQLSENSRWC